MKTAFLSSLACFTLSCELCLAAAYTVNTNADTGAGVGTTGDLRYCITQSNIGGGSNTISINNGIGTITLLSPLPIINQALPGANLSISAPVSQTISGASANRIFFVGAGTASFQNLTLDSGKAIGGAGGPSGGGGGGGAGMGGALFVQNGTIVNVNNVLFTNNNATGGPGLLLSSSFAGGGGGGMRGNGGGNNASSASGGGGGGVVGDGLTSPPVAFSPGGNGGSTSTTSGGGGVGGATCAAGGIGGDYQGGGGSGACTGLPVGNGGAGGYGGGGGGSGNDSTSGGSFVRKGGDGGFGGGGGGGGGQNTSGGQSSGGGDGGFGGGGGGVGVVAAGAIAGTPGTGGKFGGNGGGSPTSTSGGGGGGGAGLGGAIFIDTSATLNFTSSAASPLMGSSFNAGSNARNGTAGQAVGLDIFLRSGATLTINVPNSGDVVTLSNPIESDGLVAGGGVIKNGAGKLIFNMPATTNPYTGGTTVSAGNFTIDNALASDINVMSGATLAGVGTITGTVTSSGITAPGNSIGTLNIVGNHSFGSGATYQVELNSAGMADLLLVTGATTIGSNVALAVLPDPGTYVDGTLYTIIQSGSVSGTFATATITPGLFTADVLYNGGLVQLLIHIGNPTPPSPPIPPVPPPTPFAQLARRGNAQAVAVALDAAIAPPGSDMAFVLAELHTLSIDQLNNALNQLDPAIYKGLAVAQQKNALSVRSAIAQRSENIYQESCCKDDYCITVWVDGFGSHMEQKKTNSQPGFHDNTGGALIGLDYEFFNQVYIGLAGAYTYTDLDWSKNAGNGHIQSGYGSIYSTWYNDCAFVDMSFTGAYNYYKAHRHIEFADIDRTARNSHHGWEADGHLDTGLMFDICTLQLRPFVGVDGLFLYEDGYHEHGADSLNLKVHKSRYWLLRGEVGFHLSRSFTACDSCWVPEIRLSGAREWRFQGKHYRSSFTNLTPAFTVNGLNPDRSLIIPGAGVTAWMFCDQLSISLDYDAEIGRKYWNQLLNLQIGYSF